MAKRLTDNINSLYFEAANRMTSKKARRKIVAYVESYDDVFFWRSVLSKFEDETRYFDIMLPSRNQHLDRGKKAAVSSMLKGVGKDMKNMMHGGDIRITLNLIMKSLKCSMNI